MKKFLDGCFALVWLVALLGCGAFLLKNPSVLDRFFEKKQPETICTVTFECNGGSVFDAQSVENGGTIENPGVPVRDGFVFVGWYTSNSFKMQFDFSKPITRSCVVYARWVDTTDTTDTDGDGLTDPIEEFYGTNPSLADTDGDGLNDYFEIAIVDYNPLNKDTDNNGITDGLEDFDADGIDNQTEVILGTNLSLPDTDGDNLSDFVELNTYRTDPVLNDTDGDGASDGKEIELGTDPLVAQTKFDLNISADNEDIVTPSVNIELSGDQVDTLRIDAVDDETFFPDTMPGYMGQAYDFQVNGEFSSATISFEFDSTVLTSDSDPVIYYFNEETQALEELETTVNGNVASATVTHFSKYILIDRKIYNKSFTWTDVWDNTQNYTNVEVVFVIDDSGSMDWNDYLNERLNVARTLIDNLPSNSKIGLVRFDDWTTQALTPNLTINKEEVKKYLTTDYFYSSGGTDMYNGIQKAFPLYESADPTTLKLMIVLSDGATSDTYLHSSVIETANNSNVRIYTVGLGSSTSYFNSYLKPLATNTGATFYLASNAEQLADIYKNISEKIDIETDSDDDGIPDYYEDNMICFNGVKLALDKNNPDTDGDGLKDGEEVLLSYEYNADRTQVKVTGKLALGHPLIQDTDSDGYIDSEDKNPLVWDVSYRDLALLSNTVYQNYAAGTVLSSKNCDITVDGYGLSGSTRELKGWKVIKSVYNPITGFEASAYAKDNNIVIATRGSEAHNLADILQDWVTADIIGYLIGLNAQLPAMETFISDVVAKYGNSYDNFYVTGHSLGGYLALMSSSQLVKHKLDNKIKGVVTFNGLGMSSQSVIGTVLDIDDNINLQKIRSVIKNYRTTGDIVSCIGYTPGDDVTINQAKSLGWWSIGKAHSLVSFIEQFSNDMRKPDYKLSQYYGLNDEK